MIPIYAHIQIELSNPDTVFSLTEKGKREARKLINKL